jgi:polyisoprenoid-binding protein YceI
MAPPTMAQLPGPIPSGRVSSGTLSFDGHATVGDFTGVTHTLSGQITGASDLAGVRGWVEAPVQSLKTGDGKRDKDLNKSMESKKYPRLRFDLSSVAARATGQGGVTVTLHGTFQIHGVTREVELPGTVELQGKMTRVRSDFPLNLEDYGIGGLSKMFGILKMDEQIEVHVDLTFQLALQG